MSEFLFAATTAVETVQKSWMWYIIRAAGFAGVVLLVLLMLSGIGQVTGLTYRFIEPVKAWTLHKAMGIALGIAIFLHVLPLFFDKSLLFTVWEAIVPFAKSYGNGATLFGMDLTWLSIPSGVIAGYACYIVLFSSFDTVGWIKSRKRLWQILHWLSYIAIFLTLVHAILAGTDLMSGWLRWVWLILTGIMAAGIISRIMRGNTTAKPKI